MTNSTRGTFPPASAQHQQPERLGLGTFGCAVPSSALIFSAYSNLEKNWAGKVMEGYFANWAVSLSCWHVLPATSHIRQALNPSHNLYASTRVNYYHGHHEPIPEGACLNRGFTQSFRLQLHSRSSLLPCFWKAKLQLTSVLAHIPCEWSQGSALPSCGLCFSGFSKYDGWKSSGVVLVFFF